MPWSTADRFPTVGHHAHKAAALTAPAVLLLYQVSSIRWEFAAATGVLSAAALSVLLLGWVTHRGGTAVGCRHCRARTPGDLGRPRFRVALELARRGWAVAVVVAAAAVTAPLFGIGADATSSQHPHLHVSAAHTAAGTALAWLVLA
jgi:hypothetical protein